MKIKWMLILSLLALSACSEEAKENLNQAAENAKAAARNVGEAVSESTKEINQKWSKANENRIEMPPNEDTTMAEPVETDAAEIKQSLNRAKDATIEKIESLRDENNGDKSQ